MNTVKKEAKIKVRKPDPNRFKVAKKTLLIDQYMTYFIRFGGISIIAAVFGIFIFILWQVLPLFNNASVGNEITIETGANEIHALGVDEWGELPFVVLKSGKLRFFPFDSDPTNSYELKLDDEGSPLLREGGAFELSPRGVKEGKIATLKYSQDTHQIAYATKDGKVILSSILYKPKFKDDVRTIKVKLDTEKPVSIAQEGNEIMAVDFFDSADEGVRFFASIQRAPSGDHQVLVKQYKAKKSLLGTKKLKLRGEYDLSDRISGTPDRVLISDLGDGILVSTVEGRIFFFRKTDEGYELFQSFSPFGNTEGKGIASLGWLLGRVSFVATSHGGENEVYSMALDAEVKKLQYKKVKTFDKIGNGAGIYDYSLRNRAFLIGSGYDVSLRYATTETVRWERELAYKPTAAVLGPKYDSLWLLDGEGALHILPLDDPHPEAGFSAFFREIWYEGQPEPDYIWQSTGAESSFEAKLSMVPLLIGSFKGTFFAMLFAVPIAVLSAVYTSQFLSPSMKRYIKPAMEIMASLPSVVLGFLAALWLAPILENRVPSLLLIFAAVPAAAFFVGWFWGYLPQKTRNLIRPGYEFWIYLPVVLCISYFAWQAGPAFERMFFTVVDPTTGQTVADFRLWWPEVTGLEYVQRNSLVVGFIMGFAIIPIIFTIAEDSMTNVPSYLTSASLALGASRWQTAWRVVLPTASPGIFSAFMIGLGRAVGETMIVVMATGNTPIMDMNIFSGMRTLAANIAVELPEAPHHSTLYRSLFLGALLLFILTFLVNTVAEITRQRLRDKYKTVG